MKAVPLHLSITTNAILVLEPCSIEMSKLRSPDDCTPRIQRDWPTLEELHRRWSELLDRVHEIEKRSEALNKEKQLLIEELRELERKVQTI